MPRVCLHKCRWLRLSMHHHAMEKYILSRFVLLLKDEEGRPLAFNTRYRSLLQMPADIYEQLDNEEAATRSLDDFHFAEPVREAFLKNKLFVPSDEDKAFVNAQVCRSLSASFGSDWLSVTLAPTLDCNFACPYCFEKHKRKLSMSGEDVDNFLQFVDRYPKKKLALCWYGGEPLLAFDAMQRIAAGLRRLKDVEWGEHSIVTNGYLIDDAVIAFFKEYRLKSIQITLDGCREHHDRKRFDKRTHAGSFDHIVGNVSRLLSELPETALSVRVNVDRTNVGDFFNVVQLLKEKFPGHAGRLHVYPGLIRIEDKERRCWGCESLTQADVVRFYEELERQRPGSIDWLPGHKGKGCTATNIHGYVIAPNGDIYKCWNDLGDPARVCGNIAEPAFSNPTLVQRYLTDGNGLTTEACRQCALLPVCDTGCAWERVQNAYAGYRFDPCTLCRKADLLKKALSHYIRRQLAQPAQHSSTPQTSDAS